MKGSTTNRPKDDKPAAPVRGVASAETRRRQSAEAKAAMVAAALARKKKPEDAPS